MKIWLFLLVFFSPYTLAENTFWQQGKTDKAYDITVYRSASCGCCKGWIAHLKDHHFVVNDITVDDVQAYKTQHGIPPQAASCHTAVVNDVVIEGHVPAQDIKRLLAQKTDTRILTVPSMPSGTPGMDSPGAPKDNFRVYSISHTDKVGIFKHYDNY
jgi:hypothetical protein